MIWDFVDLLLLETIWLVVVGCVVHFGIPSGILECYIHVQVGGCPVLGITKFISNYDFLSFYVFG